MARAGMAAALALLTACAGAAAPVAAPAPAQTLPTLHVLTIGVEHYLDRALRQEGAEGDAAAFADSLRATAVGAYAVSETRLIGASATREAVAAAMDGIIAGAKPSDAFALYYRGLGSPRFLVLADSLPMPPPPSAPGASPPESFERRLLRTDQLARWLVQLPARARVLVLDAPDAAAMFQELRPLIAATPGAPAAPTDLTAFAMHGPPIETLGADGRVHGVLTESLLHALGEARDTSAVVLASSVALTVLARLDHPVLVHQAGGDIVVGAREDADGRARARALQSAEPWTNACGAACPRVEATAVENTYTLVGRAQSLPAGSLLFVNGRRVRLEGTRFEVELAPAALRSDLRVRALLPDGARFETVLRLP